MRLVPLRASACALGHSREAGHRGLGTLQSPKELLRATDPFGSDNLATLSAAFRMNGDGRVVLGWGDALPKPLRAETSARILGMTAANGVTPMCLGRTQNGQPRHPLMLAYVTPLEQWSGL